MGYEKKPYRKWNSAYKKDEKPVYKPKRGELKPLMSEEEKASAKVEDLAYDFACRMTRLFQYLTEDAEYKEYIISKQIFRSGTSIGANMNEAKHPQSDADFLSKANIALKEARETEFWLNLLHDNGYISNEQKRRVILVLVKIYRNRIWQLRMMRNGSRTMRP